MMALFSARSGPIFHSLCILASAMVLMIGFACSLGESMRRWKPDEDVRERRHFCSGLKTSGRECKGRDSLMLKRRESRKRWS